MAKLLELDTVLTKLDTKKKEYLSNHFVHYVVEYRVCNDYIYVISNIGRHCKVKNTKENEKKLNQVIVKNKVIIMNRINNYNESKNSELNIIILSIILCGMLALCIWLSLFAGSIPLLILSCIALSLTIIPTTTKCFTFYLWSKEIENLKMVTNA